MRRHNGKEKETTFPHTLVFSPVKRLGTLCVLVMWMMWLSAGLASGLDVTETSLKETFDRHLESGAVEECDMALEVMLQHFPDSGHLPEMEYQTARLFIAGSHSNVDKAIGMLTPFLPGGHYESSGLTPKARLEYARALVVQKRFDEALSLYHTLAESDDISIVFESVRYIHTLSGVLDMKKEAAFCEEILEKKLSTVSVESDSFPPLEAYLAFIRAIKDSSEGMNHLKASGRFHRIVAEQCERLEVGAPEVHWKQAYSAYQRVVARLPRLPLPGTINTPEEKQQLHDNLKVRFDMALIKRAMEDYEGCRLLLDDVYRYIGDFDPPHSRLPLRAGTWMVACDMKIGTPDSRIKELLMEILVSGKCDGDTLNWAFKMLAGLARKSKDTMLRYLYLRDLIEFLDDPGTEWAVKDLRAINSQYSGLEKKLADTYSPAYIAMSTAGFIKEDPSGKQTFFTCEYE